MLLDSPTQPRFGYLLAHGAGAGMRHPFLESVARELGARNVATLRYEFPYMEQQRQRPDPPPVCAARVREAAQRAAAEWPGLPLIAGGKSFGGRMTSTAQAETALPGVRGLAFLGFPLHAPGRPSVTRAEHLSHVQIPMLFLQGTRDDFAQLPLITSVVEALGSDAVLQLVDGADHSFRVPQRMGRSGQEVIEDLAERLVAWGRALLGPA